MSERAFRRTFQIFLERPTRSSRSDVRFLIPVLTFAAAFVADILTDRRWSSAIGGSAILVSAAAFAQIRRLLVPVGVYVGVWIGFNVLRAFADDANGGLVGPDALSRTEAWLAGGALPSAVAQTAFLDPANVGPHHVGVTAVYLSYFVVPHVIGAALLWRARPLYCRYLLATAILFGMGLVGFVLLPMNPPWLASETNWPTAGEIVRVPDRTLATAGIDLPRDGSDHQGYAFEPNSVASMPSMHLGVTALLAVMAWGRHGGWRWLALGYVLAMGYALVVSGEHYVLDIAVGAAVALLAWRVSGRLPLRRHRYVAATSKPHGCWSRPASAAPSRAGPRSLPGSAHR